MVGIAAEFAAVILLGLLLSLLWDRGLLTFSIKRALFFAASRGKARYSVQVSACTGYVKRGLRLDGEVPYRFWLEDGSVKGELRVEVRSGDSFLLLDAQRPAGILIPGPRGWCSLTFRFRSAEGGTALSWEIIS